MRGGRGGREEAKRVEKGKGSKEGSKGGKKHGRE